MILRGWADLYAWQLDRASRTPLTRQIYIQVRSAVLSGALRPGTRMPSSRAMASKLGVARASVVLAYEHLLAEGYVESRHGSGTFIAGDLTGLASRRRGAPRPTKRAMPTSTQTFSDFERSAVQSDARPFNTGRTLIDARTAETWRSLTHRAVRRLGANDLGYTDPAGLAELRGNICDYLRAARAVRCDPEQIVITAGTQQAIDIAIRVLLAPGDEVWVEDPGYPLTHAQLLLAKARPHPIPVDAQGLVVDAGLRTVPRARAAFVTPSHQFPTGVALSMARRLELLAWARRSGAFVVEDDYTSEFRYSGPPLASLQGLDDTEQVIYVGTLNKALFPGLRIGYAVVPRDTPGLTVARCNETIGCRFMNNGELVFEDMRVPGDHLLVENDALGKASVYFRPGKIIQAAKNLGVGVRALEAASDYVQNYVQGGRILIKHQAVALRLADMATRITAVRSLVERAARAVDDEAPDAEVLCNMAKVFASEEILKVAQHCLELHGGNGVMLDFGVEKIFRDAVVFLHMDATVDISRFKIVKSMFPDTAGKYAGPE